MWSSRLFWKLFSVYVVLNLALAAGVLLVVDSSLRDEVNRQVEHRLLSTGIVVRSHVEHLVRKVVSDDVDPAARDSQSQELRAIVAELAESTEARLTIVDSKGRVLADSDRDPDSMMDHANRPELIEASKSGVGTAKRHSPTLQVEMLYLCLRIDLEDESEAFVRVAERMDKVHDGVAIVRRISTIFFLAFGAIATIFTYAVVGRVIHPLADLTDRAQAIAAGEDRAPLPVQSDDEVGLLADSFNQMQVKLTTRFKQLRHVNEQTSTVLGSMDEGIIAVDRKENIVLANDACKRMLNIEGNEEIGRPLLEAVRSRKLQEIVKKCLSGGGSAKTEFESSGQSRRDLSVRATCLPGEPVPGVVVVLHDISELRRLENLRHEFVANVSHELKTPLASIKAYAETLRMGALDDAENNTKFVARIEDQADRLHRLILDMLQIARVESGEEAFDITKVSIAQVVEASMAEHRRSAEKKQIQLMIEPPDEMLIAVADEDGLRAIVDNLITNAIKYTPEAGSVFVRWFPEADAAVIEVQDTGIGIAEKHQMRVFERFYRVDKARSREMGGTGLGLSIVKHLSQAFGGSVTLASVSGEGTTFRVQLPCG